MALLTQFQDTAFGHFKRGRATIASDFDLDGYVDFYMGNPGDESYILRSVPVVNGGRSFELTQVLVTDQLTWGGVSFDYDNDGDYDLFIACGGNEGIGFDYLFRNDWILEGQLTGQLLFTDVTAEAGVAGIVPEGESQAIKTASGNAVVADYDLDGDIDIFVNGNFKLLPGHPELQGRNTVWRNNSDGTFTDVTMSTGLGEYDGSTRHSTWFDFDNDGYPDLYENVFGGCNVLWRNNGDGTFADVTAAMSAPGHDLSEPQRAFSSVAADFNNDGWEDLLVFMRAQGDGAPRGGSPSAPTSGDCGCNECIIPPTERVECDNIGYPEGHLLFINRGGLQFENVSFLAGINEDFVAENGVMGCQIGDVNADAIPDVYVGNGGPDFGQNDRFYLSTGVDEGGIPHYENATSLIDYPAEIPAGYEATYPYRTHGVAFVDFDNDGTVEIAVSNGGPRSRPDSVREPDRLFKFFTENEPVFVKIRLVGNGTSVSRDAIGTKITLIVRNNEGTERALYRTLYGGSSFSAQNGFDLIIGLRDGDTLEELSARWTDGTVTAITEGLSLNTTLVVSHGGLVTGIGPANTAPQTFRLEQNYPNPFNPSTLIRYSLEGADHVSLKVYSMMGEEIVTLINEYQEAGQKVVSWNGRNTAGQRVATGVYMYKIITSTDVQVRKMMLVK
ncbi:MAG: FG-GAP-like repeat-containing protein [Ignavibacteria bacterium]|nr:FG-GAP-like repeat-containing protein [Ignavibacteria bacterium]